MRPVSDDFLAGYAVRIGSKTPQQLRLRTGQPKWIWVNRIRHENTNYDDIGRAAHLRGRYLTDEQWRFWRARVLTEIARAYPDLKEACLEQLRRKK